MIAPARHDHLLDLTARNPARWFHRRAWLALACVAVLIVLHQALLQPSLARLTSDAPVINVSGRQRMLSQRLAKAALALESSESAAARRACRTELQQTLAEWQRCHRGLQHGDAELKLPRLRAADIQQAFDRLQPHFAAIVSASQALLSINVERFDAEARAARRAAVLAILEHEPGFVEQMHGIVCLFEEQARAHVAQLQSLGLAIMTAVLVLLVIVQLVIVQPAVHLVDREFALSEEQYRRLVESMNDGVVVLDRQGRVQFASPRFGAIVGYSVGDLLGKPSSIFVADADRSRWDALLRSDGQAATPIELALQHRSGQSVETLASPRGLCSGDGEPAGWLLVLTDITARKAVEAHSRRLFEQLAHANRLKSMGEMAAGLAHEINQPLGAISNYAEGALALIERGDASAVALREPLGRIRQAALRCGEIVRRARAFAQLRPFSRAPVDVNHLVHEVEELCRPEARRRGVAIHLRLADGLPAVPADGVQIQQVLTNLVQNAFQALEATEPFRRRLTFSTAQPTADMLEISVRDQGPGIPAGHAERLFEPFVTTRADGTGMGLAIARSIVEAHGGRIWVEAPAGGGADFRFTLPLEAPRDIRVPIAAPPEPPRQRAAGASKAVAELVHG